MKREGIERINLLKMDIEGSEIDVLSSLSKETLEKIDQITVEFHDFLWPELNKKVEETKNRLCDLGFYCIPFSVTNNGGVLFIRKKLINKLEYFYLKYFYRYLLAVLRAVRRI